MEPSVTLNFKSISEESKGQLGMQSTTTEQPPEDHPSLQENQFTYKGRKPSKLIDLIVSEAQVFISKKIGSASLETIEPTSKQFAFRENKLLHTVTCLRNETLTRGSQDRVTASQDSQPSPTLRQKLKSSRIRFSKQRASKEMESLR